MAGKIKDLFAVLAEQHRSRSDGTRLGREPDRDAESGGGGLVEAVKDAVKGFRGEGPKRPRTVPRREPLRVPRGLLIPGWLLAGMVVFALGSGFLAGRVTARGQSAESLAVKPGAEAPGAFRDPTQAPGYLPKAEEEKELFRGMLVQLHTFYGDEREAAAMLAQQLRARGLAEARIRHAQDDKGRGFWLTVCYVDPPRSPDAWQKYEQAILARIRQLEGPLGFKALPEIKDPHKKKN